MCKQVYIEGHLSNAYSTQVCGNIVNIEMC